LDVEIGFIVGFNVGGQNMGIMKISYFLFTDDIELFCEEILNILITYEYDSTKFYPLLWSSNKLKDLYFSDNKKIL